MKIKDQTIQALNDLSEAELMLVNEWINQLRESHHSSESIGNYEVSYEEIHEVTQKCKSSLSEEILSQREDRL